MANFLPSYLRRSFLGLLTGVLAGISSTIFLYLLDAVTNYRDFHLGIVYSLPLVGFLIGTIYHFYGQGLGIRPILKAIQNDQTTISWKTAPFVFVATLFTHLFGGSAGREGTAIQISAGVADMLIPKIFRLEMEERKTILQAALGAGFGSAIGVPLAGFIFGLEIMRFRRLIGLWECFVAAGIAQLVTIMLHAPHSYFPKLNPGWMGWKFLFVLFAMSFIAGVTIRIYLFALEWLNQHLSIVLLPIRTFCGGILIAGGFFILGSRYLGLGIPLIQEAFMSPSPLFDPWLKALFTLVTIASGFKGGEFIPLIFMGATLGSSISPWVPGSLPLLPAIGFPIFFAAASKTPLACTVMAAEIFGPVAGLYTFPVCVIATLVSGKKTIYPIDN